MIKFQLNEVREDNLKILIKVHKYISLNDGIITHRLILIVNDM